MAQVQVCKCWIDPILSFLKDGANRYLIIDGNLYKIGYVIPFLACLHPHQAQEALLEIYEGLCGGHPSAMLFALKIGRQGYFWPTILKDAQELVKKYDKCQRFVNVQHLLA